MFKNTKLCSLTSLFRLLNIDLFIIFIDFPPSSLMCLANVSNLILIWTRLYLIFHCHHINITALKWFGAFFCEEQSMPNKNSVAFLFYLQNFHF